MSNKTIRIACKGAYDADINYLIPFQGELKSLSKENYEKLKKEILELGFSEPVCVWQAKEGELPFILNGHQRVRVLHQMRSEGYEIPPIPVTPVMADDIKQAKRKVLALTSQYGQIERQGLYEFMESAELSLKEIEESFRFPEINLDDFAKEFYEDVTVEPGCDEDEVPEHVEPKTKLGDIYQLGRHRLMCGDSTSIDAVEKLMGGERADMVFTDPPYGIAVVHGNGSYGDGVMAKAGKYRPVLGDESTDVAVDAVNLCLSLEIKIMIFWGANYFSKALPDGKKWIVWDKKRPEGTTFADCELAWTNVEGGVKKYEFFWHGMMQEGDREKRVHPTQKPVGLVEKVFSDFDGAAVLDLFGGSGSTLIACEKTQRQCFMMELDPHYCDVIVARWEKFTGQTATLISQQTEQAG